MPIYRVAIDWRAHWAHRLILRLEIWGNLSGCVFAFGAAFRIILCIIYLQSEVEGSAYEYPPAT